MQKLFSLTRIASSEGIYSSITDLFFSSLEKAVERLMWENENNTEPYGLCECYYDFAVIEEADLDGNDPDWLFQKWYQLKNQENGEYRWIETTRPSQFGNIVSFYSSGK